MTKTVANASTPVIALDDAILVERAQRGEMDAFGQLVAKYQDRIYNAIYRIAGGPEEAGDLTQETFLKAMASIGRFRHQSGFYTWLFRIAMNQSISARRKRQRRSTVSLSGPDGDWELDDQAAGLRAGSNRESTDPSERILRRERADLVESGLQSLDPEQRIILVMRDMESMDYATIGEILEVPVGTVKSRLHRARMALREKLRPMFEQE